MLRSLTGKRAPVLLSLSADELCSDRKFQNALHRYLTSIETCHRERITDNRREAELKALTERVEKLDPTFFSKVALEWRQTVSCGVRIDGHWSSCGAAASIEGNESHLYYFSLGWPTDWQLWLRKEDCLPCDIWHYNGGPDVWESALAKLKADDPDTWITTLEKLDLAFYRSDPKAMAAIGTHEALLTKPLTRCGVRKGQPEEVLNMHTGQWEPTGYLTAWAA